MLAVFIPGLFSLFSVFPLHPSTCQWAEIRKSQMQPVGFREQQQENEGSGGDGGWGGTRKIICSSSCHSVIKATAEDTRPFSTDTNAFSGRRVTNGKRTEMKRKDGEEEEEVGCCVLKNQSVTLMMAQQQKKADKSF